MKNLIEQVKKERKENILKVKKEKIKRMLDLIEQKEKELDKITADIKGLKEQLEKGDFSRVELSADVWSDCYYYWGSC